MARSIEDSGLIEPIILTADHFIVSGHRRYQAARLAGLREIDCRIRDYRKDDDHDRFMCELREANRQRIKTRDEIMYEEAAATSPDDAYAELVQYRQHAARVPVEGEIIRGHTKRAEITKAKFPLLDAIADVLDARKEYWPISVRQVHYALLNHPPLRHASKPASIYRNDRASYRALVDLLSRARIAGIIDMDIIHDPTRPVTIWNVRQNVQEHIREQIEEMFKGYWRDLLQSQPNHIELVVEKNTVLSIVKPLAAEYTIPITSGRGQCSLPPRRGTVERFKTSGKERLILLILTDADPDGDAIANAIPKSLRDDFSIDESTILPIRVALTPEQANEHGLSQSIEAKTTSPNYQAYVERHGSDAAFELEALDPADLQDILRTAIDNVLDIDAYEYEVQQEKEDASFLTDQCYRVKSALGSVDWQEDDPDVL